ncbi:membrane associated RING finger, putative [Perkinsus marinus ATCC 50983]|uniref:Membrane associated RING finger, putative n=1 Tax=Perkinsus marinus (strain ATCC 50983 / TXsc) TaxID=423536 RepID=C5L8A8_PERM5|nr:membrane associated RING finger, putative [Perkinsus marinus ATCC 50983]EER07064.1 membrane associated RING finger, putative [Perkinsus marinus ATCC 50983]|eukprot:XP_002775248.1 membrane associated RING finger, putative [Perkinsus marinus ATCC 50983]
MITNTSGILEVPIINTSRVIIKNDDDIDEVEGSRVEEPLISIGRCNPTTDDMYIKGVSHCDHKKCRPWLVVHDPSNAVDGVSLKEGDILRLGRVELRVRQMVYDNYRSQSKEEEEEEEEEDGPTLTLPGGVGGCCSPSSTVCSNDDDREEVEVELQLLSKGVSKDSSMTKAYVDRSIHGLSSSSSSSLHGMVCRICLMEGTSSIHDPFVAPCHCSGSIKYVHINCLRHWIGDRLRLPSGCSSNRRRRTPPFLYRPLTCELCKALYPTYVNIDGNIECLYPLPHVKPPYIVFELNLNPTSSSSFEQQQEQDGSSNSIDANIGLNVVSLGGYKCRDIGPEIADNNTMLDDNYNNNNKTADVDGIIIGRGHDSDVRISDVSISRKHCLLRYHNGQFYIQDLYSKFGTLLSIPSQGLKIPPSGSIAVQVGRTVLRVIAPRKGTTRWPPSSSSILPSPPPNGVPHIVRPYQIGGYYRDQPAAYDGSSMPMVVVPSTYPPPILHGHHHHYDNDEQDDDDVMMVIPHPSNADGIPSSSTTDTSHGLLYNTIHDDDVMMIIPHPSNADGIPSSTTNTSDVMMVSSPTTTSPPHRID